MAGNNLRNVHKAAVLSFFWDFVLTHETRTVEGDQADIFKHLKTTNLEGKRELVRERWVRLFHTLVNAKSPRLDPSISEDLDQWPENMPLGVQPTMKELTDATRSLADEKTV